MVYNILELYSGIGGMHCAWKESGLPGKVCAAADVNTVANVVYSHNFPDTPMINRNIQSLTPAEITKMNVNTILMSPPCQPFSRNGKYLDHNDPRTDSFLYLIGILQQLETVQYLLMENVKGFELSTVRNIFIEKLKECNFDYQEFLICPMSVGVPNSRLRYYCIARKKDTGWQFKTKQDIIMRLPKDYGTPFALETILQDNVGDQYLVPDKLLKWANVFDICHRQSQRSCCFTKSYTHYIDGTGSIFTEANSEEFKKCLEKANRFNDSEAFVKTVKELKLRYFTPQEVLYIMMFPATYSFPEATTTRQCYRLLGNSLNVKVVSELIKILCDQ